MSGFIGPSHEAILERYGINKSPEPSLTITSKSLTLRQIALLYIYQNKSINRSQADEIAQHYGHKSGEKLYKQYNSHSSTCDRTGVEGGKIIPMIKDIETVIPLLSELQKQQAEKEKNTINAKISDQS